MKPGMILRQMLLGTLLATVPPDATPAAEPVAWQLRATAQVDGTGIFADTLIDTVPALPRLRLGASPAVGRTNTYSRAQLTELLREQGASPSPAGWAGADQVRVTRRQRLLESAELLEMITTRLQQDQVKDRGELELQLTRPWPPTAVPDEPLTVKVLELPATGVSPNFILRFELRSAAEGVGRFQIPLQAHVFQEVWVAGSALTRGQRLREADLSRERRDILGLRGLFPAATLEDSALELAENVAAGAPLLARSVRLRAVMPRGKVVDAMVSDGTLLISVKVEALEDGLPGQIIRVRNLKSKREFRGKVQNEETILVSL